MDKKKQRACFKDINSDFKPQQWTDLELAWNTSVYQYNEVVLPVDRVWTPELHVTNGSVNYTKEHNSNTNTNSFLNLSDTSHLFRIKTTMKHSSPDLLVYSNGTVRHNVILSSEVNCEVNLFNYPFAADRCPVALQTWAIDGEFSNGMKIVLFNFSIFYICGNSEENAFYFCFIIYLSVRLIFFL